MAASERIAMTRLKDDQLAWILGSSRTGSTWLLRMLADTGEISPIDDPHLGHHLGTWRPVSLAWATAEAAPELTTLSEVKRSEDSYFFNDRYRAAWAPALRELIAARFTAEARDHASSEGQKDLQLVVKEPASQQAQLLLELFPGSRVIFLLRDGRDAVDSWLDAYTSRGSWAQEGGAFQAAPAGRLALVRWLAEVWLYRVEAVQRACAAHDPARWILVRYEDLLAEPRRQLARVTELLGLRTSDATIARICRTNEFEATAPAGRGEGQAMRLARPGGWRENLRADERDLLSKALEPKLAELGYGELHETRRRPQQPPLAA